MVIYNEVAVGDLQTKVFFWPLGTVADVNVAVDVIETQRFRTILDIFDEFIRLRIAYKFERELWATIKNFHSMREKGSTSTWHGEHCKSFLLSYFSLPDLRIPGSHIVARSPELGY